MIRFLNRSGGLLEHTGNFILYSMIKLICSRIRISPKEYDYAKIELKNWISKLFTSASRCSGRIKLTKIQEIFGVDYNHNNNEDGDDES